ncbi:MAG: PQQ-binding-like beta-propeller repeat protein [Solirubrobacterales bacterium]
MLAIALGGLKGTHRKGTHTGQGASASHIRAIVPGGPLAPASVGGLAALWAPQNVVGAQSGTAAAYEAASGRSGLPGYLMIADRGNNRILVVNPGGHVIFRYPRPGDHAHLFYDDDTFVEPGGEYIIANEEDNHAIVQVSLKDRRMKVLFGHPGEPGSDATHVNTPDDAYRLPNGSFTVADASNCRILFIRTHHIVRSYGRAGICRHHPPHYFTAVNGDTPVPGGGVMVSEIEGSWIDEIGPQGRLRWTRRAPVSYPSDPQPLPGGRVLLADYASPGHVLIIDRHGRVLWRYGPTRGFGMLDHPSLAMALPNGDVAVNDDYRDRVVIIDPRTNKIVWKYGYTDTPGTAAGHLNTPDGMDFIPAGADGSPDYAAVVHP